MSGECAPKNAILRSKVSKKYLRTPSWPVFSKFCLRRRIFGQNKVFLVLWKSSKIRFSQPEKVLGIVFLVQFLCVFKKSVSKIKTRNDSNTVKKRSNHLKLRINMGSFVELHHLKCRITQNSSKLTIIAILRIITQQSARMIYLDLSCFRVKALWSLLNFIFNSLLVGYLICTH